MKPTTLFGGLLAFAGYTLVWWGVLMIKNPPKAGPGVTGSIGFVDMVLPSRYSKVSAVIDNQSPSGGGPNQPSTGGPATNQIGRVPGQRVPGSVAPFPGSPAR